MIAGGLVRSDLRNLRRDPMLLASASAPFLVAALIVFGFDPLVRAAAGVVDLAPHRPLFVGGAMLLTPLLAGFVVGFLLVEEREERILDAVAVTPRGTSGFLRHRTLLPAIIGGLASLFVGVATGSMSAGRLMLVATLAAGSATLVTLTMVAVARDRVQALAVSKLTGLLLVAALAFQFVEGLWRLPLGAFPSTWIVEAVAGESLVAAFGIGSVTHLVAGGLLIGRVRRTLRGR